MSPWVKNDPNTGGVKIPPAVQQQVKQRVLDYAAANYAGKYTRLTSAFAVSFVTLMPIKNLIALQIFHPKTFPYLARNI